MRKKKFFKLFNVIKINHFIVFIYLYISYSLFKLNETINNYMKSNHKRYKP